MYTVYVLYSGDWIDGDKTIHEVKMLADVSTYVAQLNNRNPPKSISVMSCGVTVAMWRNGKRIK